MTATTFNPIETARALTEEFLAFDKATTKTTKDTELLRGKTVRVFAELYKEHQEGSSDLATLESWGAVLLDRFYGLQGSMVDAPKLATKLRQGAKDITEHVKQQQKEEEEKTDYTKDIAAAKTLILRASLVENVAKMSTNSLKAIWESVLYPFVDFARNPSKQEGVSGAFHGLRHSLSNMTPFTQYTPEFYSGWSTQKQEEHQSKIAEIKSQEQARKKEAKKAEINRMLEDPYAKEKVKAEKRAAKEAMMQDLKAKYTFKPKPPKKKR